MDTSLPLVLLVIFLSSCFIRLATSRSRSQAVLPPGPPRLPIIGNILQIGKDVHRSIAHLSKTYGPIMSLKVGSITTVVISSSDAAREVLQTHDQVLSSRAPNDAARGIGHEDVSMACLPASARWRFLRKIATTQLFLPHRLEATMPLRKRKVQELMNFLKECCDRGEAVDIGHASFVTSLNIISNILFSVDFGVYDSEVSHELQEVVVGLMKIAAKPNIANFFPVLGFLDLQGIRKQTKINTNKLFQIIQEIIDARLSLHQPKDASSIDLVDSLLEITQQHESEFSINDMKHMLLDLFAAGIDTTSSTVEWAMTELLRNPKTMARVQDEIRQVIGQNSIVQESDIPKLPYVQAVVKETFRLHPPVPFLIPRKAESNVSIFGFLIPKNAQILVNVWDIGQDPKIWNNPLKFEPERFLGREIDVRGKDFELTPFGAGRRICPGMLLGLKMVHLVLASLLNSFDWKLQTGVVPKDLDMAETFGLTLHKAKPLLAVPIKKETLNVKYSKAGSTCNV